jgi:hypothetical protein
LTGWGRGDGPIATQFYEQVFNLNKWQLGTHQRSCNSIYTCLGTPTNWASQCTFRSETNNTLFTCEGTGQGSWDGGKFEKPGDVYNGLCNGTKSNCVACGTTTCSTDGKGACNINSCASVADMMAGGCALFTQQTLAVPYAIPCTDPLALRENKYTNINMSKAYPSWFHDATPHFDSEWDNFYAASVLFLRSCYQVAFSLPGPDGEPGLDYCVHEPGPQGHHCVNFATNHSACYPHKGACVGCAGGTHGGCQDASTNICYPVNSSSDQCMVDPPGCVDTLVDQKNWTDNTGKNGCGVYAYCDGTPGHCAKDLNWCEAFGGPSYPGAGGLDPNQACCACGGGSSANQRRCYVPDPNPCFNESLYTLSQESAVPVQTLCTMLNLTNCSNISFEVSVPIPNSQPGSPTPAPGPAPPTPAPPSPAPTPAPPTPAPPGPAPTPVPGGQCTGCIGGSKGDCKAVSNVCFPATAGTCPPGTTHC